jgi:hypothetical protein
MGAGKILAVVGVIVAGLIIVWAAIRVNGTHTPPPSSPISANPPAPSPHWTYTTDTDPMTDAKIRIACTTSLNEVSLDWPYHDTTAELCIRDKPPKSVSVFLMLDDKGQILCGLEYCSIPVRFDKDEEENMGGAPTADHATNVIFFNPGSYFMLRMDKKKSVTVQLQLYQNGTQDIRFDLSNYHGPWSDDSK